MSRYFFHLFEAGEVFPDVEGAVCHSLREATARALKEARSMLAEDMLRGQLRLDRRIDITDAFGELLHALQFEAAFSVVQGAGVELPAHTCTRPERGNPETLKELCALAQSESDTKLSRVIS